jgi:hypothetical protein
MKSITNINDLETLNTDIEIEKEFYNQILEFAKNINLHDFIDFANFILIEDIKELYQNFSCKNCVMNAIVNSLDKLETIEKHKYLFEIVFIMNNDFFVSIFIPHKFFESLELKLKKTL